MNDKAADPADLVRARTENLEANTALLRLKEAQLLGELAPINVLEWCLSNVCAQISAHLATLPGKLKRKNPNLTAADIHIIRKEIAKVCEIASRAKIELDAPEPESPNENQSPR